ncbi:DUF1003 domain-containing protein [Parasphingorhabdus halotolerans]|uniref:DUF1003 domain-containing protein n=1 Tax=Parasphingorhabdus halotolerans TaxID=2725558 RepID=A0A6H2DNT2_9SPHN|nr:DUF1003 domain-containing protein [Parasphingorhabdus halotolerans]QJB70014.1 DUF1003 domain-containing protein [Parasphingorhabdus halotolerans]
MNSLRNVDQLANDLLGKETHELGPEERNVLESIYQRTIVSEDAADRADEQASFGERLSDRVAAVGGSWAFIIAFAVVLFGWMLLNSEILTKFNAAFDPYPFIFLNLMLSTLAAIQAPIIMMSQNRASNKDRIAAAHDYEVNLRAEIDIIRLHEKIDLLTLEKIVKLETDLAEIKLVLKPAD